MNGYQRRVEETVKLVASAMGSFPVPTKPAITATRMKGEDITELRSVVVGQKPGKVLLELTPEAAEMLSGLLGWHISGPDSGPRYTLAEIWRSLRAVGVRGSRLATNSESVYLL